MEPLNAHSTDTRVKTTTPMSRGTRLPYRSESGPTTSWPIASPNRHAVIVNWAPDAVAPISWASAGNTGRYRSIATGPKVVSIARTIATTTPASATGRPGRVSGVRGRSVDAIVSP